MIQFKTKIITNEKVARDHYVLAFKKPKSLGTIKPGQFFNIRVSELYSPFLRRPFGVHKIEKDKIKILYKVIGDATRILSLKKTGEALDVLGPIGNGFDIKHKPNLVFLIAGGHGVAPLYALAERFLCVAKKKISNKKNFARKNTKIIAFIGAKTKEHVICGKQLRKLGSRVYVAAEDGSTGYRGLITDLFHKKITDYLGRTKSRRSSAFAVAYAVGPRGMLKKVAGITAKYNLPCQVSLEEYIACGTGVCLGCAVKTRHGNRLICKDGPVFDAREILWQK